MRAVTMLCALACAVAMTAAAAAGEPRATSSNVCSDPGSSPACNVCAACCHSFIPSGTACDSCAREKCVPAPTPSPPVPNTGQRLIVDTDMGFDVDDAVAVCLANALHDAGKVNLLAVVHDTGCELGIGAVSAINHFYGHDNVTLGAWKGRYGGDCNKHYGATDGQNQYLSRVIAKMPGPVTSYNQAMLGTDAYRKALATAPNASVNIASIGMPTNLADLLATKADAYSPLSGYDLVAAKVNKIVFMDGMYNFGCAAGNIGPSYDCYGNAQTALKMPPGVSLVFSTKGENPDIYTGSGVMASHPDSSPCKEALKNWCCNPNGKWGSTGRLSWDPITVMIAAMDVGSVYEKEVDVGTQVTADPSGEEHFFGNGTRNARTDFNDGNAPAKIRQAIDYYLDTVVPGRRPGWSPHTGDNCWPGHGATDLEKCPSCSAGPPMTIASCEDLCSKMAGCTAVTVQVSGAAKGMYDCYRKKDVDLGKCDHGTSFDTYTYDTKV